MPSSSRYRSAPRRRRTCSRRRCGTGPSSTGMLPPPARPTTRDGPSEDPPGGPGLVVAGARAPAAPPHRRVLYQRTALAEWSSRLLRYGDEGIPARAEYPGPQEQETDGRGEGVAAHHGDELGAAAGVRPGEQFEHKEPGAAQREADDEGDTGLELLPQYPAGTCRAEGETPVRGRVQHAGP